MRSPELKAINQGDPNYFKDLNLNCSNRRVSELSKPCSSGVLKLYKSSRLAPALNRQADTHTQNTVRWLLGTNQSPEPQALALPYTPRLAESSIFWETPAAQLGLHPLMGRKGQRNRQHVTGPPTPAELRQGMWDFSGWQVLQAVWLPAREWKERTA